MLFRAGGKGFLVVSNPFRRPVWADDGSFLEETASMTLPIPRSRLPLVFLAADQVLTRRWVRALLFTLVFVLAWLLGTRAAHAAGLG